MVNVYSLKFKEYKSLKMEDSDLINLGDSRVSLIIGKNNCGKSSLIDVIASVFDDSLYLPIAEDIGKLQVGIKIQNDNDLLSSFPIDMSGSEIGGNYYEYAKKYVGKCLFFDVEPSHSIFKKNYRCSEFQPYVKDIRGKERWERYVFRFEYNRSQICTFRRVNADRDISPEAESQSELLLSNGDGATNLIRKFITHSELDENLVEHELLDALNEIMAPEAEYTNFRVQEIEKEDGLLWEIFLEEENGKRYSLSKCGSGLKTIILILINLILIPHTNEYKDKTIVYAFEEIENNLHPALQRRIFKYIYEWALRNKALVFITSHSHVAINMFYGRSQAKIFHIVKANGASRIQEVASYVSKAEILDDLDVKASDIFQSNGIIWVEGPSDRLYINRWLQLISDSKLQEGQDFQYMYYGGKLLSHYTTDENIDELINVMTINRHAAIVIDSDKRTKNSRINDTKRRVRDEFNAKGLFCWITKGKEIENYISCNALNATFGANLTQIGQFALFPDYISEVDSSFSNHKVQFAKKVIANMDENERDILDLGQQITKLYARLLEWSCS